MVFCRKKRTQLKPLSKFVIKSRKQFFNQVPSAGWLPNGGVFIRHFQEGQGFNKLGLAEDGGWGGVDPISPIFPLKCICNWSFESSACFNVLFLKFSMFPSFITAADLLQPLSATFCLHVASATHRCSGLICRQ